MSSYHKLPIAQKRAQSMARQREPSLSCSSCGTQLMPVDLIAHVQQRCPGKGEPGPSSQWARLSEVIAHGVPSSTLHDWVATGKVTRRGTRLSYEYLWRDLAPLIVKRMVDCRRNSGSPELEEHAT